MKHFLKVLIVMAVMLSLVIVPVTASAITYSTLTLDNKNPATWARINDNTLGTLNYLPGGPTFDFNFIAAGLEADTAYSLVYYANPWPGNNPGKLIGTGTSVGTNLTITGSPDLNMNLPTPPDSNMVVNHCGMPDNYGTCFGAKIWLVPSDCYDVGTNSIIAWSPTRFLFETDLINYIDTDVSGVSGGTVDLLATITEPEAEIGLDVVPVSNPIVFGDVDLWDCSDEFAITLTNSGTVPVKVEALASAGFFTDCLRINNTSVGSWESDIIDVGDSLIVYAKICIYTTTYSGSQSGSVTFVAHYAPSP